MFIVGIDIGKRNHEATIIEQKDFIVEKLVNFDNTITGFNRLMETVSRITNNDVVFGMEATGHYWLALYTHLRKRLRYLRSKSIWLVELLEPHAMVQRMV